jgi:hypothetical protein
VCLIETMEKNMNLQTQSNVIENDEEKMKWNLQKLHVQREKWRMHDKNALSWSF